MVVDQIRPDNQCPGVEINVSEFWMARKMPGWFNGL